MVIGNCPFPIKLVPENSILGLMVTRGSWIIQDHPGSPWIIPQNPCKKGGGARLLVFASWNFSPYCSNTFTGRSWGFHLFPAFFLPLPAYLDICELVEGSHIEGEKTCEPRGYCKHRLDKLQQKNTATYDSKKTFAENKRDFWTVFFVSFLFLNKHDIPSIWGQLKQVAGCCHISQQPTPKPRLHSSCIGATEL